MSSYTHLWTYKLGDVATRYNEWPPSPLHDDNHVIGDHTGHTQDPRHFYGAFYLKLKAKSL